MTEDSHTLADRRKLPRVNVSFLVEYSFKDPGTNNTIAGQARAANVSGEGVCLRLESPAALLHGGPMDVILHLPKVGVPIVAKGRVRWTKGFNGFTHTGVMVAITREKTKLKQPLCGPKKESAV